MSLKVEEIFLGIYFGIIWDNSNLTSTKHDSVLETFMLYVYTTVRVFCINVPSFFVLLILWRTQFFSLFWNSNLKTLLMWLYDSEKSCLWKHINFNLVSRHINPISCEAFFYTSLENTARTSMLLLAKIISNRWHHVQ